MKIKSAVFETSAPDLKSCPNWNRPEFAFIGRSNVGKSSLINLLAGQRTLALVSDKPGKTKLINFFIMNGSWCLVDLPGYGYASTSKQDRFGFNVAVADYLEHRETLRAVFVLIDSRLPPQQIDLAIDRGGLLLLNLDARLVGDEGQQQDRKDHEQGDEDRRQPDRGCPPELGDPTHGSCIRHRGSCGAAGWRGPCRSWSAAATCGRR